MPIPTLDICNLKCRIDDKIILKNLNLKLKGGEVHVIMGPNGTGKSTMASMLMGHPSYEVVSGSVKFNNQELLEMDVDERARAGLFLAMQYPAEISGVTNADFLRMAVNAHRPKNKPMGILAFQREVNKAVKELEMLESLPNRYLNEGFSGGEKKRNEILQMMMIKPSLAILDEIDSGLDVDALRIVGTNIMKLVEERGSEMATLVITHYQRLLDYIKPDFVHILMGGKIVRSGDYELALKVENEGYDWLRQELGTDISDDDLFEDPIEEGPVVKAEARVKNEQPEQTKVKKSLDLLI